MTEWTREKLAAIGFTVRDAKNVVFRANNINGTLVCNHPNCQGILAGDEVICPECKPDGRRALSEQEATNSK